MIDLNVVFRSLRQALAGKMGGKNVMTPYWKSAYAVLVEHYKFIELRLQERLKDLEDERIRADALEEDKHFYKERYKDLQIDYMARLKALGMSDQDIEAFDTYWHKEYEE